MNSVHLIGRLTSNPELQFGGDKEIPYCNFSIAVDRLKNKEGSQETDFPRITAFGKIAENMNKYLVKGNLVCVDGSIRTSSYEKDGQKQYSSQIVANHVQFLQWNKQTEEEA